MLLRRSGDLPLVETFGRIIDLLPNNKIRVRVARNFTWLPDGPNQQYFRPQLQSDFFRSRFNQNGEQLVFVNGMLSRTNNLAIQSRIRRLSAKISELHDARSAKRYTGIKRCRYARVAWSQT